MKKLKGLDKIFMNLKLHNKCISALYVSLFLSTLFFSLCVHAKELPQGFEKEAFWFDGKWAHEHTNIPHDPKALFGRLENGFRYVVLPHQDDPNRVALYLNVQVGSLMEEDDQLGFAHIVEHMVFNGSENFPAGSLIPFFHENGMNFGGDTNAFTTLDQTVYKINLSENTDTSLGNGIKILRDFADKVLFEEKEVQKEIGVVIAEKNSQESEASKLLEKRNELLYANTKFVDNVIGTEETIKSANSKNLKAFYDKWYTPDRMVLVVVGDVDKAKLEKMISDVFSSMEKKESVEVESWGVPKGLGINPLPEVRNMGGAIVSVMMHYPRVHTRDSIAQQKENLLESIVKYSVNQRLQTLSEKEGALWMSAHATTNYQSRFTPTVSFNAVTDLDKWKQVLEIFTDEIARVKKYGITQAEIDEALESSLLNFNRFKQGYDETSNSALASTLVSTINSDKVYTSLDFDEKLLKALLAQVTRENVNKKAREIYSSNDVSLIVGGKTPPTKEEIEAVWNNSQTKELAEYKHENIVNFPYLDTPKMIEKANLPKLQEKTIAQVDKYELVLSSATLANGVDVYILPLPFSKKHAGVQLIFGDGYAALDDKKLVLSNFSEYVLAGSGLGNLSLAETRKLAKKIDGSVSEQYSNIYNMISIIGDSEQLETLLQATWTQYVDPKPLQEAIDQTKFVMKSMEADKKNTLNGVISDKAMPFFYDNLKRYQSTTLSDVESITLSEIEAFAKSLRDGKNVSLLICGDIDVQHAYLLAAQYFNDIKSQKTKKAKLSPIKFPAGKKEHHTVKNDTKQAIVWGTWFAPLTDLDDRELLVKRQLVSTLIANKLREDLREEMGAVYSPSARYNLEQADNGYGFLEIAVDVSPEKLQQVVEYIRNLKPWTVEQEDLDRLREPIYTSWESGTKRNSTWQSLLLVELVFEKPFIQWNNDYLSILSNITKEEITQTLKDLLTSEYAEWSASSISKKGSE